jgi:hypothetical protein
VRLNLFVDVLKNGMRKNHLLVTCIAATIAVEILFAAKQAKRLERKACVPPYLFTLLFF